MVQVLFPFNSTQGLTMCPLQLSRHVTYFSYNLKECCKWNTALQAATILVAMASGKNNWRLKFWQKLPIGDLQI